MRKNKRKHSLTLLEIMIVIFLIGLIGSVVGYNMKGSIDEGRVFRTEQSAQQLRDILLLEVAKGERTLEEVIDKPADVLKTLNIVKNPEKLVKDGWDTNFQLSRSGDDIAIVSKKYNEYCKKKGKPQKEL